MELAFQDIPYEMYSSVASISTKGTEGHYNISVMNQPERDHR